MRMSPHVGGSVYRPKRTVDSNRRGFAEQRTRLSPVLNRVDQSDGPDGRGPTPLTMTWVGGFSTGSGRGPEGVTGVKGSMLGGSLG